MTIWSYQGISFTQGGYLHFHFGTKLNHRLLWIRIQHLVPFGYNNPTYISPSEIKLRLQHPRGHRNQTSKLRHISRDYGLLRRLINMEQKQTPSTSTESIKEYKDIYLLLIKERFEEKPKVICLHMIGIQYSRMIKLA